jgi:hypothetical protein
MKFKWKKMTVTRIRFSTEEEKRICSLIENVHTILTDTCPYLVKILKTDVEV